MSVGFARDYVVNATGKTEVFVNGVKQASTSGSTIDFTVPSGIKAFSVSISLLKIATGGLSTGFRLGDSGGVDTGGYSSVSAIILDGAADSDVSGTTGFLRWGPAGSHDAADLHTGVMHFVLHDAATNHWICNGNFVNKADGEIHLAGGEVTLDNELTTVQLYTADTFDGGSVNIQYENPELAVSGISSTPAGVTDVFVNGTVQATTSGSSKEFTLPSGVKKFSVTLSEVSSSSSGLITFELEDATSKKTTGYKSIAGYHEDGGGTPGNDNAGLSTTRFIAHIANAAASFDGIGVATFTLHDPATNTWLYHFVGGDYDSTRLALSTGTLALDSEITSIHVGASAGTFDAGSVNIQYDNQELDLGSGVISGGVVQTVNVQDGELQTGTTVLPWNDTIPQNTEGDEFMTASITPTNSANKLKIEVACYLACTAASWVVAALFQDSTADALAGSGAYRTTGSEGRSVVFTHWMTAGTASSTTFKVRGGGASGTTTFNGAGGARRLGGVIVSGITITEYKT